MTNLSFSNLLIDIVHTQFGPVGSKAMAKIQWGVVSRERTLQSHQFASRYGFSVAAWPFLANDFQLRYGLVRDLGLGELLLTSFLCLELLSLASPTHVP